MKLPKDKQKHMIAGISVFALSLILGFSMLISISAVYAAGIGKEIWDYLHPKNTVDFWDIVATVSLPTIIYLWMTYV